MRASILYLSIENWRRNIEMKVITLGEILLRLSTAEDVRLKSTKEFRVCYGGAEANVGISLAHSGHDVSVATVLPQDNPLNDAVSSRLRMNGINTDLVATEYGRLGTYFLEQGNAGRASRVTYDRLYSSISVLNELCWNLDEIFKGVDLLHISGILPALSKKWQSWTVEVVRKAKEYGCRVSFDMNYRSKLWSYKEAYPCFQQILPYVDILSASRLDAIHFLKVAAEDEDVSLEEIYKRVQVKYPNIKVLYSTKRNVISTNHNELQGFFVGEDGAFVESKLYDINPIIDRVGGGDAFAAGILNGVLKGWDSQQIIDFGTARSVLKHTVFGDWNPFNEDEVFEFMNQKSGQIVR